MISRKAIVALVLIVSAGAFAVGAYVYQRNAQADQQASAEGKMSRCMKGNCHASGHATGHDSQAETQNPK